MTLRALAPHHLVDAWEAGHGRSVPQQALAILRLAEGLDARDLSQLTVGRRDAILLELRARTFGPTMQVRASCPHCGQTSYFAVDVADIQAADRAAGEQRFRWLEIAGWRVRFRRPEIDDLDAAAESPDVAAARAVLLRRCVAEAASADGAADPAELPGVVVDALSEAIEAWDPLIETALAVECAGCGRPWRAMLEIGTFLYNEIEDYVGRLLREVDELARRYGWREADILGMSSLRRRRYLALAG